MPVKVFLIFFVLVLFFRFLNLNLRGGGKRGATTTPPLVVQCPEFEGFQTLGVTGLGALFYVGVKHTKGYSVFFTKQ